MKERINKIIWLIIGVSSILIVSLGISKKELTYEHERNIIFNIINNSDVSSNTIYKNYTYYCPEGFIVNDLDSQVQLKNNKMNVLIHFGTNESINDKFYLTMNVDKVKKFEYIDESDLYFIVWEYDVNNSIILIGQNDQYVEAVVDNDNIEKELISLAQIYASIRKVK